MRHDRLAEGRQLRPAALQSASSDEGGAVEDQLVLAADLVDIEERQAALGDARHGELDALVVLVDARKGEPLTTIRISAPVSARHSVTSGVHMSSQTMTPSRTPRKISGPGSGPGAKTRFSSNTP